MSGTTQRLPVHGFVLAGGKSSRMGRDKAALPFCGVPLVERAVATLRCFCEAVSISGNREDLAAVAPPVQEVRLESGPVAGLEACLGAATRPWCLFMPVDVPLVPWSLLAAWTGAVLAQEDEVCVSYLRTGEARQPAFCLLQRSCGPALRMAVQAGERRLGRVLEQTAARHAPGKLWVAEAEQFAPVPDSALVDRLFTNVNTPEELASLEAWAAERTPGA